MRSKSIPFMLQLKVPVDIAEGQIHDTNDGGKIKITKIKSVQFVRMDTMVVIGLCVPA